MGVLVSHTVLLQSADAASDAQLVARAIEGDRWGREMLYRRHATYLLAIAAPTTRRWRRWLRPAPIRISAPSWL